MDWVTAIKEIQKAQEDDRLVIFVGAGVSKNSGIPSWWELIKKFADELGYSRCDTCEKKLQIALNQIAKTNMNTRKMSFFASQSITISKIPLKTMAIILA